MNLSSRVLPRGDISLHHPASAGEALYQNSVCRRRHFGETAGRVPYPPDEFDERPAPMMASLSFHIQRFDMSRPTKGFRQSIPATQNYRYGSIVELPPGTLHC